MRLFHILITFIVFLSGLTHAEISMLWMGSPKFKQWFSNWEVYLLPKGDNWAKCVPDLEIYWSRNASYPNHCSVALSCILQETDEGSKQLLGAIMVLLGAIPTLLALTSPTVTESALLSMEYPSLTFLLAFGSAAVHTSRIMDYVDPLDAIDTTKRSAKDEPFTRLANSLQPYRRFIVVIEHILGLAAVVNTIEVTLDLGLRSVASIDCDRSCWPLSWALVSVFLHLLGVVSFWTTPRGISPGVEAVNICPEITAVTDRGINDILSKPKASIGHEQIQGDVSSADRRMILYTERPSLWSIILQYSANGYAIGHVLFGTMVFSSLMFLALVDAIPVIARYHFSAVTCSVISRYELAVMSQKYRVERVEKVEQRTRVHIWTRRMR
ncbi:uncharacterized protein F4822DRAFT_165575 [Hypoxylon trugodes]|uniref:uncharacterized protein n=1 Tax=Hypoxylon trugodes TaxID=326681 RepID=UPI002190C15C|nr:uncharacterized protein F4822DRAFT_165575 [Hypoxylon trugodes]KAI1390857.1 hypothetical protein F4822DRAFT_165575 [Hypoxylon trugodes]